MEDGNPSDHYLHFEFFGLLFTLANVRWHIDDLLFEETGQRINTAQRVLRYYGLAVHLVGHNVCNVNLLLRFHSLSAILS